MSWKDFATRSLDSLRMLWKRALSYRKRAWELGDYPIRLRVQKDVPEDSRFWARILGWNVDGLGKTRADALRELEKYYDMRKASCAEAGESAPRPGTSVPIKFASQERVSAYDALKEDFIHHVLDLEWAFLSDESSLYDFTSDGGVDTFMARIKDVYGVDVSDVADGNIAGILERIAAGRVR